MFRIGQKVVCISERHNDDYCCLVPRFGAVYTVREIDNDDGGIRLVEIINARTVCQSVETGVVHWNCEPSFYPEDFRPLVERRTDIGFAHEILRKATKRRHAHAE